MWLLCADKQTEQSPPPLLYRALYRETLYKETLDWGQLLSQNIVCYLHYIIYPLRFQKMLQNALPWTETSAIFCFMFVCNFVDISRYNVTL